MPALAGRRDERYDRRAPAGIVDRGNDARRLVHGVDEAPGGLRNGLPVEGHRARLLHVAGRVRDHRAGHAHAPGAHEVLGCSARCDPRCREVLGQSHEDSVQDPVSAVAVSGSRRAKPGPALLSARGRVRFSSAGAKDKPDSMHLPAVISRPRASGVLLCVVLALVVGGAAQAAHGAGSPVRGAGGTHAGAGAGTFGLDVLPYPGTPDASSHSQIDFYRLAPWRIGSLTVTGSRSGGHAGRLASLQGGSGVAFIPERPFTSGERVTVRVKFVRRGSASRSVHFGFAIASPARAATRRRPPARTARRSSTGRCTQPRSRSPSNLCLGFILLLSWRAATIRISSPATS